MNKKWHKKKIKYARWWNKQYLDIDLMPLILRYEISKHFERERELGLSVKEKINTIERLKEFLNY